MRAAYGLLWLVLWAQSALQWPESHWVISPTRDIDPPHFKKSCLPRHPLHSGAKCSPVPHGWLWHLHSHRSQQNSDFASLMVRWTDRLELQPYFCSDSLPWVRPSSLIGVSCLWSAGQKDGAQERVSHLGFAGLCDNLQQRAMSRRCLPLQQPLRRVSKDPPPHWFVRGLRVPGRRARTAEKAHGTSFSAENCTRKTGFISHKGGLYAHRPYCLGLCSRLRHNNDVFSLLCWSCCLMVFGIRPPVSSRETRSKCWLEQIWPCQTAQIV